MLPTLVRCLPRLKGVSPAAVEAAKERSRAAIMNFRQNWPKDQRDEPLALKRNGQPPAFRVLPSRNHNPEVSQMYNRNNPFLPTKPIGSKKWRAPPFSLRRQNVLLKHLENLGWKRNILPPTLKDLQRLAYGEKKPNPKVSKYLQPSPHLPDSQVLSDVAIERKGPYKGRIETFKGTVRERHYKEKQESRKALLDASDERAEKFKKETYEARIKNRSPLPL